MKYTEITLNNQTVVVETAYFDDEGTVESIAYFKSTPDIIESSNSMGGGNVNTMHNLMISFVKNTPEIFG